MKINEFAVVDDSQVDEAPIGALRRAGTKLASFFSSNAKNANKVQSAVNALYKEYEGIYKQSPEKKPTGQSLLDFIKGKGYPIDDKGGLTGVFKAIEKAKQTANTKPDAVDPADRDQNSDTQTGDNTIQFPTQDEIKKFGNLNNSMYEAITVKPDTVLSSDQVADAIEYVVRDSYANDAIQNLAPGKFTPEYRKAMQSNKQQPNTDKGKLTQGADGVWEFK